MKTASHVALAALLAATLGATSFSMPATAQDRSDGLRTPRLESPELRRDDLRLAQDNTRDRAGRAERMERPDRMDRTDRRGGRDRMGGGRPMGSPGGMGRVAILDLVCAPRGAEVLDVALVRLSYRVGLTEAQRPAFEDLRATALTEQTRFADACQAMGAEPAEGATAPTLAERLERRIALQNAYLTGLEALLPKLQAFQDSLTEEQRAMLERRGRSGSDQPDAAGTESGTTGTEPGTTGTGSGTTGTESGATGAGSGATGTQPGATGTLPGGQRTEPRPQIQLQLAPEGGSPATGGATPAP